jgi:hypothetical protein
MMKSIKLFLSISILFTFIVAEPGRAQVTQSYSLTNQLHTYLKVIHAKKHFSGEFLVAKGRRILFREAMESQHPLNMV